MTEEVMKATIHSMLSMPQVKVITFEFQGGEASTNARQSLCYFEAKG